MKFKYNTNGNDLLILVFSDLDELVYATWAIQASYKKPSKYTKTRNFALDQTVIVPEDRLDAIHQWASDWANGWYLPFDRPYWLEWDALLNVQSFVRPKSQKFVKIAWDK